MFPLLYIPAPTAGFGSQEQSSTPEYSEVDLCDFGEDEMGDLEGASGDEGTACSGWVICVSTSDSGSFMSVHLRPFQLGRRVHWFITPLRNGERAR